MYIHVYKYAYKYICIGLAAYESKNLILFISLWGLFDIKDNW